jgi:hypothetical protein
MEKCVYCDENESLNIFPMRQMDKVLLHSFMGVRLEEVNIEKGLRAKVKAQASNK